MEIAILNMYQRLRDFNVPAPVLDELFSNDKDLDTLTDSWKALEADGLNGDEIASEMAKIILDELGDELIQSLSITDEK